MNRVVITGLGVISPIGLTTEDFFDSLVAGRHGIAPITHFDTSDLKVRVAAEVKDFDYLRYDISKKDARRMDRYCQFAVAAAKMAMDDCGSDLKDLDPFRVGVIVGSGIGGQSTQEDQHTTFITKGPGRVSPFFVPMMIANMAAGMISIRHGFKGVNYAPVTACSSANHAIGEAFHAIKHGYIDACLTGGAEAAITKFAMAGFQNMTALSTAEDPDRASIPFDAERDGFVMGEGSAILVLEEYEHAKARGAKIYAEIVGYGATGDAYHMTSPDPEGAGGAKAMEFAIAEAGISPADVGYINAHGTSTPLNDKFETNAIKQVFGEAAKDVAVSSTKSMTGHLLGAAGAVEAATTALALQKGILPPTAGYQVVDPACDLDYITEGARKADIRYAISNSLGFGGHNATLCLKKFEG